MTILGALIILFHPSEEQLARAVAMRDTDQGLTSVIVVRADGPINALGDLRGRRVRLCRVVQLQFPSARGGSAGAWFVVPCGATARDVRGSDSRGGVN